MLYPQETTEKWSKKYKISPVDGKCPSCGIDIRADIPFADKKLRGFISEDHGCGIEKCLINCVSTERDWLEKIVNNIEE